MLPLFSTLQRVGLCAALLLCACAGAHAALPIEASPERVWRAVLLQPELDASAVDAQRFQARAHTGERQWQVEVDWDASSGGALLHTEPSSAEAQAWAARVAAQALTLPHRNKYCRGPNPDLSVPEPSIDAAHSCDPGNYSSAIHELEKCGDHETTLRLLAACVRTGHALGLIRIAQLYETGLGLPRRPDRSAEFVAMAAHSGTTGYARTAKVLWATALYFGEGVAADRPRALALFQEAADAGDADARQFLAEGWHAAWRRLDGSLYRDPDFVAPDHQP
jgi:TPR repeat protein